MTIRTQPSKYHHIEWIDIHDDNTMVECAVMKRDNQNNIYFINLMNLDGTDRDRLRNIVLSRNAKSFALWDLMQQVTLGNGVNALEYFHQLVKVLTPTGKIIDPIAGRRGIDPSYQQQQATRPNNAPPVDTSKTDKV